MLKVYSIYYLPKSTTMTNEFTNALRSARVAARDETVRYLFPEAAGRPHCPHAVVAVAADRRFKLSVDNVFNATGEGREGYLSPLYGAEVAPARADFLYASGTIRLLGEQPNIDQPTSMVYTEAFATEDSWVESAEDFYRLPTALPQTEERVSTDTENQVTNAAEARYCYLGLDLPEGANDLHLLLEGVADAREIVFTLNGEILPVCTPLDGVSISDSSRLDREVFTLYRRRKVVAEAYPNLIRLTIPAPGEHPNHTEEYPQQVIDRMEGSPSLIVLTLHLRPRPEKLIDWQSFEVATNAIPCWAAHRLSSDTNVGEVTPVAIPQAEHLLAVESVQDGGANWLVGGNTSLSRRYQLRRRRQQPHLLEELSRIVAAGEAILEEIHTELNLQEREAEASEGIPNWEFMRANILTVRAALTPPQQAPMAQADQRPALGAENWYLLVLPETESLPPGGYVNYYYYSCLTSVQLPPGSEVRDEHNQLSGRTLTHCTGGRNVATALERLEFIREHWFTVETQMS